MFRKLLPPPALIMFTLSITAAQTPETPCTPGISFWNLLGSVNVGYADGRLNIDKLIANHPQITEIPQIKAQSLDPSWVGRQIQSRERSDRVALNTNVRCQRSEVG